jgi:hypothetical protein
MKSTNDLNTATHERERKGFETLALHFSLLGFTLIKGDPAIDGQAPYFAARWGMGAQPLVDLDAAEVYLLERLGAGDGTG